MKRKLLALLVFVIVALSLSSFVSVDVHAQVGTIYSKYTTIEPNLDGTIHDSEWADAVCYEEVGDDERFTIYLMHGDEYLYIGLKIKDNTYNADDWISISFDEGNDRRHGSGSGDGVLTDEQEDWKGIMGDGRLSDGYWEDSIPEFYMPGYGVAVDFEAEIGYHANRWEVEFKIPFQGDDGNPDDLSDLNIDVDDAPKMEIDLLDRPFEFINYPEGADYKDPDTYVVLKFDNEPPTMGDASYTPTRPTPDDVVNVYASVTDDVSGLKSVTLLYSTDGGSIWTSVAMIEVILWEVRYKAQIPKQVDGTTVQFKVSAEDNAGFTAESTTQSYTAKALIFGLEPIIFYGLIGGVIAVVLLLVFLLMRRRAPPAAPPAVTCPYCGTPITPEIVYCPSCGRKVR